MRSITHNGLTIFFDKGITNIKVYNRVLSRRERMRIYIRWVFRMKILEWYHKTWFCKTFTPDGQALIVIIIIVKTIEILIVGI